MEIIKASVKPVLRMKPSSGTNWFKHNMHILRDQEIIK